MSEVKSIMPVQIPGRGWDVRLRLLDGTERFLCDRSGPYTLAQAEVAADGVRRDVARHGVESVFPRTT